MKQRKKYYAILTILFVFLVSACSNGEKVVGWNIKSMHVNDAWNLSKGSGQVIAFLDTGISKTLIKDYSNRITAPYNVINSNDDVNDTNGHGTEIVSAACSSGKEDILGIAPESKIMPIRVFDSNGHTSSENLSKGINWAIDHNANIINCSFGGNIDDQNVIELIKRAEEKNIYIIASSGDYANPNLLFPADLPFVISVIAQEKDGERFHNSNYSNKATIMAPGSEVPVLSINHDGNLFVKKVNGTSVAAANISGLAALSLSVNPKLSQNDFIINLKKSTINSKFINAYDLIKEAEKSERSGNN